MDGQICYCKTYFLASSKYQGRKKLGHTSCQDFSFNGLKKLFDAEKQQFLKSGKEQWPTHRYGDDSVGQGALSLFKICELLCVSKDHRRGNVAPFHEDY